LYARANGGGKYMHMIHTYMHTYIHIYAHTQVLEQLAQCQIERDKEMERAADAQRRALEVKREQEQASVVIEQCRYIDHSILFCVDIRSIQM
jgi:hypothetical protein